MAYFVLQTPEDVANGNPGTKYDVPKTLTYGEQIDVTKELGQEAAGLGVIWITVRRQYPQTTINDLRAATVVMFEEDDDKLPPTNAAANSSGGENGKQTEPHASGSLGLDSTTA